MIPLRYRPDEGAYAPSYQTAGSAGMDIRAHIEEPIVLESGHITAVPTGLYLEIPQGYEVQVRPRSGLALKHGLIVVNSPGTIDSDYRGEVKVILGNLGGQAFTINDGDRIAQIVLNKYETADMIQVTELSETERGAGGFGSTGV